MKLNKFDTVKIVALSPDRMKLNNLEIAINNVTDLNVTTSHLNNIEITDKSVDKGQAVKNS